LRREEIAELAEVGPTWYTWLEQGRNIRASARVLQNIAAVMRLTDVETRHLLSLARHTPNDDTPYQDSRVEASLQDVVDACACPAFIRNDRYDVLAWNRSCDALFDVSSYEAVLERNFLWRLFSDSWRSIKLPNWQLLARHLIADLRVAYARHGDSPAFRSLVSDLCSLSPLFAQWWAQYTIDDLREVSQLIVHDSIGDLHVRINHFGVIGFAGLKLVLAAPERNSGTEEKLADLRVAADRVPRRGES
jgi:PAS domain-containing protein